VTAGRWVSLILRTDSKASKLYDQEMHNGDKYDEIRNKIHALGDEIRALMTQADSGNISHQEAKDIAILLLAEIQDWVNALKIDIARYVQSEA
jgi:hypothetical protein